MLKFKGDLTFAAVSLLAASVTAASAKTNTLARTSQSPAAATNTMALTPELEEMENQLQRLEQIRHRDIRYRGLSNLMADKLEMLKRRAFPAERLFRILVVGDSLMTAVDGAVKDGQGKWIKNPAAESKLGFHQAPPHLEYRNVPSQLYEKLSTQKWFAGSSAPAQGDIEFRRFSHPDFKFTGNWTSGQLIEKPLPGYEELGLPRFFDYRSPEKIGDAMEIAVKGKRYVNVVYAKRFVSGKFRIEVDGATNREVNCAADVPYDIPYKRSANYSDNDIVDAREQVDLGDTKPHTIRIVAADVAKPVRIWGIEMWSTPSFIVMNGGKSGMHICAFELFMRKPWVKHLNPDIVLLEASANDLPANVFRNTAAYSEFIRRCMEAHAPVLLTIPCVNYAKSSIRKTVQNHARTVFRTLNMPYIDVEKQMELELAGGAKAWSDYTIDGTHFRTAAVEFYTDELILPFLNSCGLQDERFKGDTDWQ